MSLYPIMLKQPVTDLELYATSGKNFRLSKHHDRVLGIYFYQKDGTLDCARKDQHIRNFCPTFLKAPVQIFGISCDCLKSHKNSIAKYSHPYELLFDVEETNGLWADWRHQNENLGFH